MTFCAARLLQQYYSQNTWQKSTPIILIMFHVAYISVVTFWAAVKDRCYLVRLGPKTGTFLNQVKSAPYEPCHWSRAHLAGQSLGTLEFVFSAWFRPRLSLFSQSEALHSSTLCPPYEWWGTGEPASPSTPHTTPYEQHTYLPTHLRRDIYIPGTTHGYKLHHGHRRQRDSCIRNRGKLDLSYDELALCGRHELGRYVCCWCGVA